MEFPVVVHHDEQSAYGATVPDLPGCLSAGDTFQEALHNVAEAIAVHLEGMKADGRELPRASTIDDHLDNQDYAGGTRAVVDVAVGPDGG